jgi:hypothetical protein
LLDLLQRERGCSGYGVEIDGDNLLACVKRGVNVIQLNLDEGLSMFDDNSFRRGLLRRRVRLQPHVCDRRCLGLGPHGL